MSKFERLISEAALALVILGDEPAGDFELRDAKTFSPALVDDPRFLGVAGIVDGKPKTALAVPLGESAISKLAPAFCAYILQIIDEKLARSRFATESAWRELT